MQQDQLHRPHASTFKICYAALLCLFFLLQGCTVGPKYSPPKTQAPAAFKELQGPDGTLWKSAAPQDTALRGNWWEIFGEPELNALEEKLDASNQNIAQSFQNLMAARAQVREVRAGYSPTLTTTPAYTRTRTSVDAITGVPANQVSAINLNNNNFDLPFDVSWEPDIWGRVRKTVREYANAAQVSAADLANERLSEQANLAVDYFELRGQDSLIDLFSKTVEADQKSLDLTQTLLRTGIDSREAVAQAELTLKTAQASETNYKITRAEYEHAIALLTGQPASSFGMPVGVLSTVPPVIPVGLPSDLLERRPDIAATERTMSEANALIGVETTAFYPNLTLTAEAGLQSSTIAKWFTWPSRFFSIGPSATETLPFDIGAIRATVAQYQAQYNADVAAYQQTVLAAFQQTEDYLASLRLLREQIEQQQEAVAAAQRYLDSANTRYRTGVDTYLNVFSAESSLLSAQQTLVTLRVQQMTSSVQLIEALGGGWSKAELPTEKSLSSKR